MRLTSTHSLLAALICAALTLEARAQVTAFTYQGRLSLNGSPANGSYDFQFRLYDAATNGAQVPVIPVASGVLVSNGLFTTGMDFGNVFHGAPQWLEIAVQSHNGPGFVTLSPRQLITPAPYATFANSASNLSGTLPATQLTGTVPNAQLSASVSLLGASIDSSEITDGTITTNDLSSNLLNGTFWKLGGNAGANPTNGIFLGTTDNLPLEFKVNGQRGVRLQPGLADGTGVPNLIGGNAANSIPATAQGSVIVGGGNGGSNSITGPVSNTTIGGGKNNTSSGNESVIGGGTLNTASGANVTVGGGFNNIASGNFATVPGGQNNTASGNNSFAAGQQARATHDGTFVWADRTFADFHSSANNQFLIRASGGVGINTEAPTVALDVNGTVKATAFQGMGAPLLFSTTDNQPLEFKVNNQRGLRLQYATNANNGESVNIIGGSAVNFVSNSVVGATIAGGGQLGETNKVTANFATVSGGRANHAGGTVATVAGGQDNTALGYGTTISGGQDNTASGQLTTIGGGILNMVPTDYATVSGGYQNTGSGNSATVGGGYQNTASGLFATASGGYLNTASGDSATVSGGYLNTASKDYSTVSGGHENTASGVEATVGGGYLNTASGYAATVGGGDFNTANNFESTVGGGNFNTASGPFSTVSGGNSNSATNDFAMVGGGYHNTANGYYATIPGGDNNSATNNAFAAGHRAKANHEGAFVWADSQNADFASTGNDQFLIRAAGGVGVTGNQSITGSLFVDSTGMNNGALFGAPSLKFGLSDSGEGIASKRTAGGNQYGLDFYTSYNARMSIRGNGNVGIGTTNPTTEKLVVSGGVDVTTAAANPNGDSGLGLSYESYGGRIQTFGLKPLCLNPIGNNVVIGASADPQPIFNARLSVKAKTDSGQVIVAYDRNGIELLQVFDPLASPGEATLIVHGGAKKSDGNAFWTLFSDRRLKQDVVPYSKGLAEIARLETVRFRYKDEPKLGLSSKTENIGAIAQDVREVFPEAVTEGQDGYLQINLNAIEWASINAIKELNVKQRELRAERDKQIGELKAENAELKARLDRIEQLLSVKLAGGTP